MSKYPIGVDISEHNGTVDFSALQKAGVKFVIIRCSVARRADKQFARNVEKCESLGIPYGVYHYSYALSSEYAANEARLVINTLAGRKPPLGVWYDMEDADSYKKDNGLEPWSNGKKLTEFCEVFCKAISQQGLKTGVYASASWLNSLLDMTKLKKYSVWPADWTAPCDYKGDYDIWQYTDALTIGGKRFDGNYYLGTLPSAVTDAERIADNLIADGVTTEANRAYWLKVLEGKATAKAEYLCTILDKYHKKVK